MNKKNCHDIVTEDALSDLPNKQITLGLYHFTLLIGKSIQNVSIMQWVFIWEILGKNMGTIWKMENQWQIGGKTVA